MLHISSTSSTYLTNKASWQLEVVTNYCSSTFQIEANSNVNVITATYYNKAIDVNVGLLARKQYPFKQINRKVKGALQSFSQPPKP